MSASCRSRARPGCQYGSRIEVRGVCEPGRRTLDGMMDHGAGHHGAVFSTAEINHHVSDGMAGRGDEAQGHPAIVERAMTGIDELRLARGHDRQHRILERTLVDRQLRLQAVLLFPIFILGPSNQVARFGEGQDPIVPRPKTPWRASPPSRSRPTQGPPLRAYKGRRQQTGTGAIRCGWLKASSRTGGSGPTGGTDGRRNQY